MKNKPAYALGSVDHALHLAQILRSEGSLRVTDAAERLGVSVSTAHRLLAMLVYRDFAVQQPDRSYTAGPMLRAAQRSEAPVALLRRIAVPHLHVLVDRVQESANLMILAGTEVHFLVTVECAQILRVGERAGRSLPAHLTSGGKAILAALPVEEVNTIYGGADGVDLPKLRRELTLVRKRDFAINDQLTEAGLTALGMAIRGRSGVPEAAISLAMPTARFDRRQLPTWIAAMSAAVARIDNDLSADDPSRRPALFGVRGTRPDH